MFSEINRLTVEVIQVKEVLKNLMEVRRSTSPVAGFVARHCECSLGNRISKEELYYTYKGFCLKEDIYTLARNIFFKRLYAHAGYTTSTSITMSGKRIPAVKGIRLKEVPHAQ